MKKYLCLISFAMVFLFGLSAFAEENEDYAAFVKANAFRADQTCTGCGKCAEACPFGLIVKTEGNPASKCIACGICAKACPMDVLEVVDE